MEAKKKNSILENIIYDLEMILSKNESAFLKYLYKILVRFYIFILVRDFNKICKDIKKG